MRLALASLIAAGAFASAAAAQDAAPAPMPEAVAPAPAPAPVVEAPAPAAVAPAPAPAPALAPGEYPKPSDLPPPAPAAPAIPAPTIAPEAAPVLAPTIAEEVWTPPPPAPPPTDPTTIALLNVLERVCVPLVEGGDMKGLSTPLGFKKKKDVWVWIYSKPYQITVLSQGSNANVCTVDVDHPIQGAEPIVVGIHNWAMARRWVLYRNDVFTTDMKRHTRSWELAGPEKTEALVLITVSKPDGSPFSRGADRSTLLYSVTKKPAG